MCIRDRWGGAYTESQQKAYADTYSDPSSIVFENYNGGLGEVRAQVESGSVTWDLVDVLPSDESQVVMKVFSKIFHLKLLLMQLLDQTASQC